MISHEVMVLLGFLLLITILLFIDLGLFNKNSHEIKFKEALIWSIIWISFAIVPYFFILFNGDFLHSIDTPEMLKQKVMMYEHPIELTGNFATDITLYNQNLSLEYITGYLIEKSLSVDNIFVIIMILLSFGVNKSHYKKILFWGIIGAIVLRFIFIFTSSALIQQFHWVLYIFGGILIFSGGKLFFERNKDEGHVDIKNHPVVKYTKLLTKRLFGIRIATHFYDDKFFIKKQGKTFLTPLFIVLIVVEFSDVVFAVDSVPAVFSVTKDPNIVFLSNICAIMGLRSLFFLLVNAIQKVRFLKVGLSILLIFIGLKMIFAEILKEWGFKTIHSLLVILLILTVTFAVSFLYKPKENNIKS